MIKNAVINIQRLKAQSGNATKYTNVYISKSVLIHPAGMDISVIYGDVEGKYFHMFCDRTIDVKQGDRIVWNSNNYDVKSVNDWNISNTLGHYECILVQVNK